MAQIGYVRHHLADIESDMSAIHQEHDIWLMEPARFFRFAWRLAAYSGVMTARARMLSNARAAEPGESSVPARAPASAPPRQQPGRREVPATKAVLSADPAFKGVLSFGSAKP